MIQLGRNPVQGGSIVIRVSFRDGAGLFYIPIGRSLTFSLYALREDGQSWEVVNYRENAGLTASSVVDIVLQGKDLELVPRCGTKRRVIIDWKWLCGGEVITGRDMVDFEIVPLPVLDSASGAVVSREPCPLYVHEVFEARGENGCARIGVLFSDSVDIDSVQPLGYLADAGGAVISWFNTSWNEGRTLAWLDLANETVPAGDWVLCLPGGLRSLAGAYLRDGETLGGSGYVEKVVHLAGGYGTNLADAGTFELSDTVLELRVGETHQLDVVKVHPDLSQVLWETDDEDVAVVDEYGLVTAAGVGECMIMAFAQVGGDSDRCVAGSCVVTVVD